MEDFSNPKLLGGIGAILMLVGQFSSQIISLVGLILIYLGVKEISESVNDPKIKSDFLISVILGIISLVMLFLWPIIIYGSFNLTFYSAFDYTNPLGSLGSILAVCIITFLIFVIFNILSAIFLKRSFDAIADSTKIEMFRKTGFIYLIAAILTFIFIGFIVYIVAYILMILAFFELPDSPQQSKGGQIINPQYTGRYCPNCGRQIPMDSQICPYCGKDFRPK